MNAVLKQELEYESPMLSLVDSPPLSPVRHSGRVSMNWFTLLIAVTFTIVASTVAFAVLQRVFLSDTTPSSLKRVDSPILTRLVLPSNLQAERRLGSLEVSGEVVNQTADALSHVEAVVELMDAEGKVVQTANSLIVFDPLPARGQSSFKVSLSDNPSAVGYRVQFREMMGRNLN